MATITHVEHLRLGHAFVSTRKIEMALENKTLFEKENTDISMVVLDKLVASRFNFKTDRQKKQSEASKNNESQCPKKSK